jgi:hypothetical protein
MTPSGSTQPLSLDLKRQVVYAALLRFAGEAQHLRDRVIDRLVLSALADTDSEHPLKSGEKQRAISVGGSAQIRTEAIQDSLRRLEHDGLVDQRRLRFKRVFFLSSRGETEVTQAATSGTQLLEAVIARHMRDLPQELDRGTANDSISRVPCGMLRPPRLRDRQYCDRSDRT